MRGNREEPESVFPAFDLTEVTIRPTLADIPGFVCGRCDSTELAVEVVVTAVGQMIVRLTCRRCGNRRQQVLEARHDDNRN